MSMRPQIIVGRRITERRHPGGQGGGEDFFIIDVMSNISQRVPAWAVGIESEDSV